MKINEKNLCSFATSSSPVDREGWLSKKGEVNKAFQRRWFVLKGNLLFYFEKKGDKDPVGVIILEGCTIELAEDEEHFSFKIMFHGPNNRSYILGADSQEVMEQWMKALACAGYDYMKLMVAELQRQLDELEESSDSSRDLPCPPPRQRHNPFNQIPPIAPKRLNAESSKIGDSQTKNKITFRELHTAYGRPILTDLNIWRHQKKALVVPEDILIQI
uniref:Putative pleckstrin similarity domain protein n=1 Tax=Xenopsylla cheopis TaxID=163159 RepID=A0A6M2DHL6_XENCH